MPNFFYQVHFYLFGLVAIASAIAFVTRKSPVAAALWLVNTMFSLAALYAMLEAHFVSVIQVLVYAGAIMVVFLFVIMLLNLGHASELADARGRWGKLLAGLLGLALLAQIMALVGPQLPEPFTPGTGYDREAVRALGAIGSIAQPLFNEYLLAFELTSVLLLVAIVGAVVIGRRRGGIDAR
ncbi:MAG TPA: NADH-quinone oxidoreductase subunit J [Gemmatimonadaceae bacterium]|jgi:NADH-quinone oxidoreductase subunit J|nr:NADH-quinone oxidoreductase subunit J [Gemmatimonadaceae bacterium]